MVGTGDRSVGVHANQTPVNKPASTDVAFMRHFNCDTVFDRLHSGLNLTRERQRYRL